MWWEHQGYWMLMQVGEMSHDYMDAFACIRIIILSCMYYLCCHCMDKHEYKDWASRVACTLPAVQLLRYCLLNHSAFSCRLHLDIAAKPYCYHFNSGVFVAYAWFSFYALYFHLCLLICLYVLADMFVKIREHFIYPRGQFGLVCLKVCHEHFESVFMWFVFICIKILECAVSWRNALQ